MIKKTNWLGLTALAVGGAFMMESAVQAIPTLQLDVGDGWYNNADQTIYSSGPSFTLYALLNTKEAEDALKRTYYISAAVEYKNGAVPNIAQSLGSFSVNGEKIDVTSDMIFGTPPLTELPDVQGKTLSPHGIFPTFYYEFDFKFSKLNQTTPYDTEFNPGGFSNTGKGMYYAAFSIDTSALAAGYSIHFDLYDETIKEISEKIKIGRKSTTITYDQVSIDQFAPNSHDAQSGHRVPDGGASLSLLGFALAGVAGLRRTLGSKV